MESALHCHDVLASEISEDKLSGVSFHCRDGEVGYVLIRELVAVCYFCGELSEARTKYYRCLGLVVILSFSQDAVS